MNPRNLQDLSLLVSSEKLPLPGISPRVDFRARIERQLDQLERAQIGRPLDQRLQAQIVALNDQGVRTLLMAKLEEGLIFRGVVCVPAPNVPEHRHLLFRFEPPPGGFCMVPPSFLVVIDLFQERVISQLDSYAETPERERRIDECESSEAVGELQLSVISRDHEVVRVDVIVKAEVRAGWPVSDSVRFEHHQEVTLRRGDVIRLVVTESGQAEVSWNDAGDLILSAKICKWGLAKEWEKILLLGA